MLIKTDQAPNVAVNPSDVVGPKLRVWSVAKALILSWRDHPQLLFDLYLFGEAHFIKIMRATDTDDSLAHDMTDAQLGEVFAHIESYVKKVAAVGRWRKRQGETFTPKQYADFRRMLDHDYGPRRS